MGSQGQAPAEEDGAVRLEPPPRTRDVCPRCFSAYVHRLPALMEYKCGSCGWTISDEALVRMSVDQVYAHEERNRKIRLQKALDDQRKDEELAKWRAEREFRQKVKRLRKRTVLPWQE